MALPTPSALSSLLVSASAKVPTDALPLEVLHNLQYQHSWSELRLHPPSSSSIDTTSLVDIGGPDSSLHGLTLLRPVMNHLISGMPPRLVYTHPDLQTGLLAHSMTDEDLAPQREWVLPMRLGEKWSLRRLSEIFDSLPARDVLWPSISASASHRPTYSHQDVKRVLLAMVGHQGKGGDGTVVYYVMQDGDVKPRQN